MTKKDKIIKEISTALSYILVAVLSVVITLALTTGTSGGYVYNGNNKLEQLMTLLKQYYIDIDKVDMEALEKAVEDAAANAMVNGLGDRWSYYISAEDFADMQEQSTNSYVGIGVTVEVREDNNGFTITQVEPGGSAQAAGIRPGDVLIGAAGVSFAGKDISICREYVRGAAGTKVTVEILRDGETISFELTRQVIQVQVASGQMLPGNIGLVTIRNFNERCAEESKLAISALLNQGATSLIFDVRNNPGGYKHELVELLDYLLPQGKLFISRDYRGVEDTDWSDAKCLEMPMAVLVNGNSYSAAEFFAAALREYEWATVVGDPTCGKGNFQYTFQLPDGSGVGLSVGKYFTPKGVSLADQNGLVPDEKVEIDEQLAAEIYAGLVAPLDDPQIQAAIKVLTEGAK